MRLSDFIITDNCGKLAVYNTVPLSNQPQTDEDVLLVYFSASLTHGCFHLIRHLDKFTRTRRTEENMNSIPKQPSYNATKLQDTFKDTLLCSVLGLQLNKLTVVFKRPLVTH